MKDAIEKKHIISNCYKEAPQLLGESHLNQPDDTAKSYILRMKAFEVSKNLEKALAECGYYRNMSKKLEDYINDAILDPSCDDNSLPKTLLNDFVDLYLWAMHDPTAFTKDTLRKLTQLINKIITILAFNKTEKHDQIIQHKLDLDQLGDLDFADFFAAKSKSSSSRSYSNLNTVVGNQNLENLSLIEKKKLSRLIQAKGSSNTEKPHIESISMEELKENGKAKKSKIVKNSSTKSKKLFQTRAAKYEEIKDVSTSSAMSHVIRKGQRANLNDTTESQINADWLGTHDRNYDSENEEIPLVSNKKTHQKKKSNLSNILIGGGGSSGGNGKTSPSNSIRLVKISSNLSGNLQIANPAEPGGMHENEGFNETIFY